MRSDFFTKVNHVNENVRFVSFELEFEIVNNQWNWLTWEHTRRHWPLGESTSLASAAITSATVTTAASIASSTATIASASSIRLLIASVRPGPISVASAPSLGSSILLTASAAGALPITFHLIYI